jgi:hypothetical protein
MHGNPFDTIESAHEYLSLLREQVLVVRGDILRERDLTQSAEARRLDALRLVDYKLGQLSNHLQASSRVLNDLRLLRRLLLGDRDGEDVVDAHVTLT